MVELLKMMVEEPNNFNKKLFLFTSVLCKFIFAAYLYQNIIGSFPTFDHFGFKHWYKLIFEGNILYCIFFYLISEFIFEIIATIFELLTSLLTEFEVKEKSLKIPPRDVRNYLKTAGVISINKTNGNITVGKNTAQVRDFLEWFSNSENEHEIKQIGKSMLQNVVRIYPVLLIIYFAVLPHLFFLNIFLPLFLIFILLIKRFVFFVLKVLQFHATDLSKNLKYLEDEYMVHGVLKSIPIALHQYQKEGVLFKYTIWLNGNEYFFHYEHGNSFISEYSLEIFIQSMLREEKKLILVTSNELSRNALELSKAYAISLIIIHFKTSLEANQKIKNLFIDRIS